MLLKEYSTLRVGGPAWALGEPDSVDQLVELFKFARAAGIPIRILGAGSSLIPNDRGFAGLVICTRQVASALERLSSEMIAVSCGVSLPRLTSFCRTVGLSGLEWGIGIPGTMGGAIWMNAGASGKDIAGIVEEVSIYDGAGVRVLHRDDVHWGHRHSSFQDHPEWLILSARLRLQEATSELVQEGINDRLDVIRATQPRSRPNVGTVFKANCKALPTLAAGLRVGSMVCCEENPGWINNLGQGTASDAYRLVRRVMWRHLWRGLPIPQIEPIFLPYDPRSEVSPMAPLNAQSVFVRLVARLSSVWRFLFKDNLTEWHPHLQDSRERGKNTTGQAPC